MADNGERKGPVAFRMDKEDYTKFIDYVESTDVGKGKIAERAVREYLADEEPNTFTDYLTNALLAAGSLSFPALMVYIDRPYVAVTVIVGVFVLLAFQPQVEEKFGSLLSILPTTE